VPRTHFHSNNQMREGGRAVSSMDRLKTLDLHQNGRAFVLIHLLCCAAMFFIFVIFEYFRPNS
jgi:hypothetical protein